MASLEQDRSCRSPGIFVLCDRDRVLLSSLFLPCSSELLPSSRF